MDHLFRTILSSSPVLYPADPESSPATGVGHEPSPPLFHGTAFTKTSQELIRFVTTLRTFGAHAYLDLPRIVVIGNQSAGKSSLVEAISGISVPRDAGTCTRCPMECRLAHAPREWSCQISLRVEYDGNEQRLPEVHERPFGPRLTHKAAVESTLRRAQAAILNLATPSERFLNMDAAELGRWMNPQSTAGRTAVAFSRNTICVDLNGPDLVDLSFVDLPGLVQNAEPDVVRLLEDLVTSYVDGNCLILVALPMSDELENQRAARIAQTADPDGLRTIGVLTKPDTLPPGSTKRRQQWLDVLEGRSNPLRHGYYCTRQPDDDQRQAGITPTEARDDERRFFKTTHPWATSTCPDRYGTENLVQSISVRLTQIIKDSLPKIVEEVAAQRQATMKQLQALPPAVTMNPTAVVLGLVTGLCTDVGALVHGSTPLNSALVQANGRVYAEFKDAIDSTAPAFVPHEKAQGGEDACAGRAQQSTLQPLYLEDVREHIRASITRELPNNVPYSAKRTLMLRFQESWKTHVMECFDGVRRNFKQTLIALVLSRFERFTSLKTIVGPTVMDLVDVHAEKASAHLETLLLLERSPYTQDTQRFADERDHRLAFYRYQHVHPDQDWELTEAEWEATRRKRANVPTSSMCKSARALSDIGMDMSADESLGLRLSNVAFAEEFEVMADVWAYFQLSSKRIADYVPLSIDQHLLYDFADALQPALVAELGLGADKVEARCAAYLAEDAVVTERRAELSAKQRQLEGMQNALYAFGLRGSV